MTPSAGGRPAPHIWLRTPSACHPQAHGSNLFAGSRRRAGPARPGPSLRSLPSSSSDSPRLRAGDRDVRPREPVERERIREAIEHQGPWLKLGRPVRIRAGLRQIEIWAD